MHTDTELHTCNDRRVMDVWLVSVYAHVLILYFLLSLYHTHYDYWREIASVAGCG